MSAFGKRTFVNTVHAWRLFVSGWFAGTAGTIDFAQLQGPGFNSLHLLPIDFGMSYVCVSTKQSGYLSPFLYLKKECW